MGVNKQQKTSVNQVRWIFDQSRDFMKQWVEHPPTCDREWQKFMEQARDLAKRGRNHPLLVGILVQISDYLGSLTEKHPYLVPEKEGERGQDGQAPTDGVSKIKARANTFTSTD